MSPEMYEAEAKGNRVRSKMANIAFFMVLCVEKGLKVLSFIQIVLEL